MQVELLFRRSRSGSSSLSSKYSPMGQTQKVGLSLELAGLCSGQSKQLEELKKGLNVSSGHAEHCVVRPGVDVLPGTQGAHSVSPIDAAK